VPAQGRAGTQKIPLNVSEEVKAAHPWGTDNHRRHPERFQRRFLLRQCGVSGGGACKWRSRRRRGAGSDSAGNVLLPRDQPPARCAIPDGCPAHHCISAAGRHVAMSGDLWRCVSACDHHTCRYCRARYFTMRWYDAGRLACRLVLSRYFLGSD
jgi:hypothetical protein